MSAVREGRVGLVSGPLNRRGEVPPLHLDFTNVILPIAAGTLLVVFRNHLAERSWHSGAKPTDPRDAAKEHARTLASVSFLALLVGLAFIGFGLVYLLFGTSV